MSLVTPYITKLEAIKQQIPFVASDSIIKNKFLIINVLKSYQLSKGLDSYGKVVGYYADSTEIFAFKDNVYKDKSPGSPYNFEWTGEFFTTLDIKVDTQNKSFDIYSTSGKDVFLQKIYDTELTTLIDGNERFVIETFVEPAIIDYINNEMAKL